jgi:inward rectifier potassium channel
MDELQRSEHAPRLSSDLRRHDTINVRALGVRRMVTRDAYHWLIRMSWPRLALLFAFCFIFFNIIFAGLYELDSTGLAIAGAAERMPSYWRDFFFSVHTVATIGYGNIYPVSVYDNAVVVVEITLGIIFFALSTGIAFARFSRPTARILFSQVLVIRDVEGAPMLMLRAANQRHNLIYSAQVRVSLVDDEIVGGTSMRRFFDLKLVRDVTPMFTLTWTIMHPIDAESPLHRWLENPAAIGDAEIVVVISGFDQSSGQVIYGRWAYGAENIRWNARFADIVGVDRAGRRTIDYSRFHDVEQDGREPARSAA